MSCDTSVAQRLQFYYMLKISAGIAFSEACAARQQCYFLFEKLGAHSMVKLASTPGE
jgi:hypothetical protein